MKHMPPEDVAADTQAKAPTRRALAKQETRAKVLAAGRRLFSGQGYEGATIRDIAAAAGMSTGAVFANFADKADLFREIMTADMDAVTANMIQALSKSAEVETALADMFMAGYAFYRAQLPLARAAFSVSWAPDGGAFLRNSPPTRQTLAAIAQRLEAAVAAGELKADAQVELRSRMLFDGYIAIYAPMIFDGLTLEDLKARVTAQVSVILAGARA